MCSYTVYHSGQNPRLQHANSCIEVREEFFLPLPVPDVDDHDHKKPAVVFYRRRVRPCAVVRVHV